MLEIDYDKIPYNKNSWSGERTKRNSFCETTIEDTSLTIDLSPPPLV